MSLQALFHMCARIWAPCLDRAETSCLLNGKGLHGVPEEPSQRWSVMEFRRPFLATVQCSLRRSDHSPWELVQLSPQLLSRWEHCACCLFRAILKFLRSEGSMNYGVWSMYVRKLLTNLTYWVRYYTILTKFRSRKEGWWCRSWEEESSPRSERKYNSITRPVTFRLSIPGHRRYEHVGNIRFCLYSWRVSWYVFRKCFASR